MTLIDRPADRPSRPDQRDGDGPVLSDGTRLIDLVDVERREVSMRLFSDPEVYELELEHLFARSWIMVAHESEIPDVGDFVTRNVGEDPVIVARGREGDIHVSLNMCTHRGMQVCRTDDGTQPSFKCPYHGWVFGLDGNLVGTPFERDMYGGVLDRPSLGLRQARVATYAGMVFVNWDDDAPPLEEFLGGYSWYLDLIYDRTPGGIECVGSPQRWVMDANWKIPSEQFNGADGYHVATLHRSLFEAMLPDADVGEITAASRRGLFGMDISSDLGHGMRTIAPARRPVFRNVTGRDRFDEPEDLSTLEALRLNPPTNLPADMADQVAAKLTDGQARGLLMYEPAAGGLFPNLGFASGNVHTHMPLGVGAFEMRSWIFVEKDAPAEFKETVRKSLLQSFGTSGTIEQDDAECWPAMQRNARGVIGRREKMRYQAFVGDRGPDGWEGGEHTHEGFSKDDSAWAWWLAYREYMRGGRP